MKELKSREGYYLTQVQEVEDRIFITAIKGMNINEEDWREASEEEKIEWERVRKGTYQDPIPYRPPMEIIEGYYYTQFDVLYECIRSSEESLTNDLFELRGVYVNLIEK